MSIGVPWQELGLSRVRVAVGGDVLFLVNGSTLDRCAEEAADAPLAVYPSGEDEGIPEGAIDLRLLARVLHPTLPDHRLATVASRHGLPEARGASAVAAIFVAMVKEAIGLDRELVALLARLLPPPLSELFDRVLLLRRPSPKRRPDP